MCELWSFVYVMLKQSYMTVFSSQILSLYVTKKCDTRKNLPSNGCPYSWHTRWCKLQLCVKFHSQVTSIFISACNVFSNACFTNQSFAIAAL